MTNETGPQARVTELVERLGALAAGASSAKELARAACGAVVAATGALEVAIYLSETSPIPTSPRLALLGMARRSDISADALRRRHRRVAVDAALAGGSAQLVGSGATDLAASVPWACVSERIVLPGATAAVVACAERHDSVTLQAILARVNGALALLLRLALAERELARVRDVRVQTRAIFDHSGDAILLLDGTYRIVAANPALGHLLNVDGMIMVGRGCRDVLACQDERGQTLCDTPDCPLTQSFADPPSSPPRDLQWRTGSGPRRYVSASFVSVPASRGRRAVIVARDSTPLKAANRMRSNFISMVSHELRTPLNSLNGFLEIVLEGQAGPLRPRQEEFLNYARSSTHALMRLVEDIVFITRADTGQFTLRREAADVAELVAPVLRTHQLAAERAGLGFTADLPADLPLLCVDESRIQQVLQNLVMNAIKFTPAPGAVTISAALEPGALRLAVRDSGPGVAPEDQLRIFERFYQSESVAKGNTAGYGLGLAIAKLIVEQHGGRIWVESPPSGGAMFAFTVPLLQDGAPCPPVESHRATPESAG
jgi:signal transduction histidine kinase